MSIDAFDFKTGQKIDTRRRRVIVSDIDMDELSTIQKVLREMRFTILGREASLKALLELVRKAKIGILMLNIDDPEVKLDELVPQIMEKYPEMSVILMSNTADKSVIQQAVSWGAAGFLVRPINGPSLKKILQSIK